MASMDDLLKEFEQYQSVVKESDTSNSKFKSFDNSGLVPMFRFGMTKAEQGKTKIVKCHFVTCDCDPSYKFSRRLTDIKQFGCSRANNGISGYKALPLACYKNLDKETETLLLKYNGLWDELSNKDWSLLKSVDKDFYLQKVNNLDIFYMYIIEGAEKPGLYLVTSKSKALIARKNEFIENTRKIFDSSMGTDLASKFMMDMLDNSISKTYVVTISMTQSQGYNFVFSMDPQKDESKKIKLSDDELSKIKPLSESFIDETKVDKEILTKANETLAKMIVRLDDMTAKSSAHISGGTDDVFKD